MSLFLGSFNGAVEFSVLLYQLACVHLCDAHYVTDASKYVSVLLLSLLTMLQLELPHINVLSKVDLIARYGELGKFASRNISSFESPYFNLHVS